MVALAGIASMCVLGACETRRMAEPRLRPTPASNAEAAAEPLGPAIVADARRAEAALATAVAGWDSPAARASAAESGELPMGPETIERVRVAKALLRAAAQPDAKPAQP
jgi:hypothetical protein